MPFESRSASAALRMTMAESKDVSPGGRETCDTTRTFVCFDVYDMTGADDQKTVGGLTVDSAKVIRLGRAS